MKKLLIGLLFVSSLAHADDQVDRVKHIFGKLSSYRSHSFGTRLKFDQTVLYYSESKVDYYATGPIVCTVYINQNQMSDISDAAVAWLIGHEVSHCEQASKSLAQRIPYTADANHAREFDADKFGKELIERAGYNFDEVVGDIFKMLPEQGSKTHPSRAQRLVNLGY